jgi:hypothetical protein
MREVHSVGSTMGFAALVSRELRLDQAAGIVLDETDHNFDVAA